MSEENYQEGPDVEIKIALALLNQRMTDVIRRLDEQNRLSVAQSTALQNDFKHSIRNAEARWDADLTARSKLNDARLKVIEDSITAKAGQTEFQIVRAVVFGLVALVLVAFATSVTRSVISHEAKPAAVVSYQLR